MAKFSLMTSRTITQKKRDKGFTLIEVLVASVILFSAIAMVSLVFRGAFLSSEKANNHITLTGVLPSILATVKHNIQTQGNSTNNKLEENNSVWGVEYYWQASLLEQKSAPRKFDPTTQQLDTPPLKYKLWQVQLSLMINGLTKEYQFNELSWTDE